MGRFDGILAVVRVHGIAVGMLVGTVFLAPAASAQSSPNKEDIDLSGVADIVNLLRMVVDPSPSPVLSSPVERAVSGQAVPSTSVSAGPRVITVKPTVTLPDIVIPEENSDVPVVVAAETESKEDETAVAKTLPRASTTDDADGSDTDPPFYYVFFFGEYVPYYKGWFYYSDTWYWGRRGLRPLEPPLWIPPPPQPPDGPSIWIPRRGRR